MYFDEHGNNACPTVVMLHGAFFVETYGRQYTVGEQYHLVVPHIKGFGKAASEIFETNAAIVELVELIEPFAPVYLIGFSLGAQLAFKLVSEYPAFFKRAIIVSPWLVNKSPVPDEILNANLKQLSQMKNRVFCKMIGIMNGMPRKQRNELADAMQLVSEETVMNCVDNHISFETVPHFEQCRVPVLAIAGSKENDDIKNSVRRMADTNVFCECQIWEKAGHNIPPVFHRRFNQAMTAFFGTDG